jgi:cytochrome P450
MKYLQMCISETLRIDPSVPFTSSIKFTETQNICGITFKDDANIQISIYHLHHNREEWITPEKFIPERFDPESEYYLTPSGNRRHPMSYGPFLGGKRVCLGKTFADNMSKSMLAVIIS